MPDLEKLHPTVVLVICAWLWVCATLAALLIWREPEIAEAFALVSISTAVAAVAMKH